MTDWTDKDGRANSSDLYLQLVEVVASHVRTAHLGDDPKRVARAIVSDLPKAFHPKPIEYVDGDPTPYAIREDGRPMKDEQKAFRQGYNEALAQTGAANLRRERDALQASLHDLLTGPNIGVSPTTADRMIQSTLREARGEPETKAGRRPLPPPAPTTTIHGTDPRL